MNFGIRADRADDDELLDVADAAQLEHVRAHDHVRVPVAAGVGQVRADAADLGGEVEDALRLRLVEQALGVLVAREVEVAPPRDEDVVRRAPRAARRGASRGSRRRR